MSEKETRFTPGPWKYAQESIDPEWFVVSIDGGLIIANVNDHWHQRGNAALIAAAPDLYAALQGLVSTILDYERVNNLSPAPGRKYCWDATEQAIAALCKAVLLGN